MSEKMSEKKELVITDIASFAAGIGLGIFATLALFANDTTPTIAVTGIAINLLILGAIIIISNKRKYELIGKLMAGEQRPGSERATNSDDEEPAGLEPAGKAVTTSHQKNGKRPQNKNRRS